MAVMCYMVKNIIVDKICIMDCGTCTCLYIMRIFSEGFEKHDGLINLMPFIFHQLKWGESVILAYPFFYYISESLCPHQHVKCGIPMRFHHLQQTNRLWLILLL